MGHGCTKVRISLDDKVEWQKDGRAGKEDYGPEPSIHYDQLNTDRDQRGQTVVNHLIKQTRLVFGQPAVDMMTNPVTWSEYGIEFRQRASPYEFPAFQHEKERISGDTGGNRTSSDVNRSREVTSKGSAERKRTGSNDRVGSGDRAASGDRTSTGDSRMKEVPKSQIGDSKQLKSKENAAPTHDTKDSKDSRDSHDEKAPKTPLKRVSHNAEMDHCSLEEDP